MTMSWRPTPNWLIRAESAEHPVVGRNHAGARLGLGRRELADSRAARLLPLPVHRDDSTEEVDSIDGEPGGFGLAEAEPGADDEGDREPVVRRVDQSGGLVDGER